MTIDESGGSLSFAPWIGSEVKELDLLPFYFSTPFCDPVAKTEETSRNNHTGGHVSNEDRNEEQATHEQPEQRPQRQYMELYFKSAIIDPNSGKAKIVMLTTELADWQWAHDNPFVLRVVLYLDKARTKADVRFVPASNVREIRVPSARITPIVQPPSGLIIPKH